MTKAHPHRQVNVHLDTVDDADIIERIEAQPSMVGYFRKLVRRDIHDERLDYVALKASEMQAENAKLRELVEDMWPHVRHRSRMCGECELPCDTSDECLLYEPMRQRMRELGAEVDE